MSEKPLKYTIDDWKPIWNQMRREHGEAINITTFCRKKLGFSVRWHHEMVKNKSGIVRPTEVVYLDFYDESARTMFLLKWAHQYTD